MTRYMIKDFDAEVLDVQDNDELLELMRQVMAFVPASNDREFVEELARQIKSQSGDVVRTDTVDTFVEDLIASGFLKPVERNSENEAKAG